METILVKIFATALALSQVTTTPDDVKTQFDRTADQAQVGQLLQAGCAHMRKAFDIEDINLDELIATALDDPQAMTGEIKAFKGINFSDLHVAYRAVLQGREGRKARGRSCRRHRFLQQGGRRSAGPRPAEGPEAAGCQRGARWQGQRFAEVFEENQRRVWIPIAEIPEQVQKSFIAAEDKRFYQHKGIDERGLIRAFIGNLAQSGRPQGGSTITQQVVKNLLVGDGLTYERKIREMIVATRLEKALSKDEILEIYLNSTYLGRSAWGIEMAARSYYRQAGQGSGAGRGCLAGGPDQGAQLLQSRSSSRARPRAPRLRPDPSAGGGHHYARAERPRAQPDAGADRLRAAAPGHRLPFRRSGRPRGQEPCRDRRHHGQFLHRALDHQRPRCSGSSSKPCRKAFGGTSEARAAAGSSSAEANLAKAIQAIEADPKKAADKRPVWQKALTAARLPLYDVHWAQAVVVEKPSGAQRARPGASACRTAASCRCRLDGSIQRKLKLHDVVLVM